MKPTDILAGIQDVVRRHLGHDGSVEPHMPLVETLQLDSVRMLTLVVEIENHFQIDLQPGDELGLVSVGDLVDLLVRRLGVDRA
jgi:acyl carrier protein